MKYLNSKFLDFSTPDEGEKLLNQARDSIKNFPDSIKKNYLEDIKIIETKINSLKLPSTKDEFEPEETINDQITREEYKEKMAEYRHLLNKTNNNYSEIIIIHWPELTVEERQPLIIKLRNFLGGSSYKLAYDPEYMFLEKVEDFIKKRIKTNDK